MPDYPALARQGIYTLDNGIRVFAGTVDDPFYIDLGGTFDSLEPSRQFSFRHAGRSHGRTGSERPPELRVPTAVAGYNVNYDRD